MDRPMSFLFGLWAIWQPVTPITGRGLSRPFAPRPRRCESIHKSKTTEAGFVRLMGSMLQVPPCFCPVGHPFCCVSTPHFNEPCVCANGSCISGFPILSGIFFAFYSGDCAVPGPRSQVRGAEETEALQKQEGREFPINEDHALYLATSYASFGRSSDLLTLGF